MMCELIMVFHIEIMSGNKTLHVSPNPSARKKPEAPIDLPSSGCISWYFNRQRQSFKTSEANVVTPVTFCHHLFSLAAGYLVSGFNLVERYADMLVKLELDHFAK